MTSGLLAKGEVLDDRFRIGEHLGSGSFGDVYSASQIVFGERLRDVALKLFKTGESVTPANFGVLFSDAIALVRLEEERQDPSISRHLVRVYDIGVLRSPFPRLFMSMQLVPGRKTLDNAIRRWEKAGHMPVATSLMLLRQILRPLAWMHTLDPPLLHGDLKPANVLMTDESRLVLTDFGLATRLPFDALGGTIQYMSAENLARTSAKEPADVFAIGVLWYEMLTGTTPFFDIDLDLAAAKGKEDSTQAHFRARKRPIRGRTGYPDKDQERIVPASEVNTDLLNHPKLEAILNRCLAYRISDRYPNAKVLLDDVERYIKTGSADLFVPNEPESPTDENEREPELVQQSTERSIEDARQLLNAKHFQEALKCAESVLKKDPRNVSAVCTKIEALAGLHKLDEARALYGTAQTLSQKAPEVTLAWAAILEASGSAKTAAALRREALAEMNKASQNRRI